MNGWKYYFLSADLRLGVDRNKSVLMFQELRGREELNNEMVKILYTCKAIEFAYGLI